MNLFYRSVNILIGSLLVISCTRKGAPLISTMQTEGLHHKWKITQAANMQHITAAYIDLRDVYHSGATAGCWYFSFTPKFGHHNRMLVSNIAGHFLSCPGDATDEALQTNLESVYSFLLTGDQLQLLAKDGRTLFKAEKATGDEKNAISRKWRIGEMINADNEQLTPNKAFIDLTDPAKASGGVGCNSFTFTITADDTYHVALSNVASTKMYCKEAAVNESVFLKVLPLVNKYQVIGDRLKLFDKDDVLLLEGRSALE